MVMHTDTVANKYIKKAKVLIIYFLNKYCDVLQ